ncbi:hypothetical protein [Woodsholea maritima]|uniref:hypothetical protein n=1 Tax=Woodsholea maritima TaxID=240237 RepID=UPI0003707650|nr:hypothetical protein [Woodsholea maritima]
MSHISRRFVRTHITPEDFRQIAWTLVDRHGARALGYAEMAVDELEEKGEWASAEAWRVLHSEIQDALIAPTGEFAPIVVN